MSVAEILRETREKRPLVHYLTNYVTANLVANATLCSGALPVMAQATEEVEEMAGAASGLVINLGTLDAASVEAMTLAGRAANQRGVPVVLDPVGVGATTFRTSTTEALLSEVRFSAVCGNAGEIATLAGLDAEVRGVESLAGDARRAVREAAASLGTTVAATGPVDYVAGSGRVLAVENGHPMMGRIVGSGCASTAVIGCFAATTGEASPETVASALACFGCAGEDAAPLSEGPGTFEPRLLDALATLSQTPDPLEERQRFREVTDDATGDE